MKTRRRQVRERIRRNRWRRRRPTYQIDSVEIFIGGVRLDPSMQHGDWLVAPEAP